jgi:predicted O-methyltransferase YrrM
LQGEIIAVKGGGCVNPWDEVDRFIEETLVPSDASLDGALAANHAAGLPPHDVSRALGKMLHLLVRIQQARLVLEIGTLGGYSTIWLARALSSNGHLISLEIDSSRAELARMNLRREGLETQVEVRVGPAIDTLRRLKEDGTGPFDFIFIDADKPSNPEYLKRALELSRPGTVIVGDNVVRNGAVADSRSTDQNVVGVRRFLEDIGRHPRLSATVIQTVGLKGYDGFVMALVLPE